MFTGIIEETGTVSAAGTRMRIACRRVLEGTQEGASIAVNGVCLTALDVAPDGCWFDLSPETLARTSLGDLGAGSMVNLERAAAIGDRLNGHIVQGHVDGTAEFVGLDALADGNWWLKVRIPGELERYVIHKGSITLDGVSLTVAAIEGRDVGVAIISHTYENTAMRGYRAGARVNVEVDLIGKYIEKLFPERVLTR